MFHRYLALLSLALTVTLPVHSSEAPATLQELWEIVQKQQAQIDELTRELAATREQLHIADERIEATGDMVESVVETGLGQSVQTATHLGGYGELHYNGGDTQEIDFHRFVLFVSHDFTEKISFYSELELEHALAGEGKPGEVEIEQAYIQFDLGLDRILEAGLFLVPVGILNETHEPETFYGVERNPVEKNIIPSTWWEAGAMFSHRLAGVFTYDLAVHSGLETSAGKSYAVRSGRQKVAKASASDLAYTGRIRYAGVPGLELAATVQYQEDITQGTDPLAGAATLVEAHVVYGRGRFGFRGLYGNWSLDGPGPEAIGADQQSGFYLEPSFRLNDRVGFFARYNQWNNRGGNRGGSEWKQFDLGVNYWPHANVVIKLDYQIQEAPDVSSDDDRFNLGIGYSF